MTTGSMTVEAARRAGADPEGNGSIDSRTYRLLGAAFLLQAIASAVSGLLLAPVDLLAPSAPDDMGAAMADLAANEWQLRASIVGEMVTVGGIVALGGLMFVVLRRHGRNVAMLAFGLYVVEAAILAMREVFVFALWWTSQEASAAAGTVDALLPQATMLYELQGFAYTLHTLAFATGATIFYILFARARILPRALVALGLIAAPAAAVGTVLMMFGVEVPLYVFIPNLPFELAAGLWLAVFARGARQRHINPAIEGT